MRCYIPQKVPQNKLKLINNLRDYAAHKIIKKKDGALSPLPGWILYIVVLACLPTGALRHEGCFHSVTVRRRAFMGFWDRSLLSARSLRRRAVLPFMHFRLLPSMSVPLNGECWLMAQLLLISWGNTGNLNKNMQKVRTILFAEDDEVVLMAYRKHLKQAGYAVISACDGLETLKNLATFEPDLLILDLMMPKFDGKALLRSISGTPRLANVPVIILTSKSFIDAEHEQWMKLADKYLIKQDCTPAMLLEAIQEQLAVKFPAKAANLSTKSDAAVPSLVQAGLNPYSTN
jgi:CheY-like chemotaxis protein